MKKRVSLSTTLALIFISIALSVSLTMVFAMQRFSSTVNEVSKRQAMYDYLTEVDKAVRQNYTGDIDEMTLREDLATAYMKAIGDTYADYITTDEYADYLNEKNGLRDGYGIELAQVGSSGTITIISVDEGSPAKTAGVKVGDVLVSIDGNAIAHTAKDLLNAKEILADTTKTIVTVDRKGKNESFSLSSAVYTIKSIESKMIKKNGYLRIRQFNEVTAEQFYVALDKLIADGAEGIIFDLRDNPGGSVDVASEMTGYLVPTGTFANSTASDGTVTPITAVSAYELHIPSVVLVNKNTSGEAELFAGALQECKIAKVYGTTTAGKSRIQEYFAISSDNAAIKISTAELSLAKAGSWELVGIVPDQVVDAPSSYVNVDSLSQKEDTQLNSALDYLSQQNASITNDTTNPKTTATTKAKETTTTTEE